MVRPGGQDEDPYGIAAAADGDAVIIDGVSPFHFRFDTGIAAAAEADGDTGVANILVCRALSMRCKA
jgi:hypothetical protein